jgi:serine/threonine protein kinase
LADFGLSKDNVEDKSKSFCGSPAYLSPEMLNQKGVGKESDLYGIGCVLYECLVGEPPYYSDDLPSLFENIRQGKLKYPKHVSEDARSLISVINTRNLGVFRKRPEEKARLQRRRIDKNTPMVQQNRLEYRC